MGRLSDDPLADAISIPVVSISQYDFLWLQARASGAAARNVTCLLQLNAVGDSTLVAPAPRLCCLFVCWFFCFLFCQPSA